jgi:hypothetical protein
MNRRQARIEALKDCAALIRVNAETGFGDLWGGMEDASDADRGRFYIECQAIAEALLDRAARLEGGKK